MKGKWISESHSKLLFKETYIRKAKIFHMLGVSFVKEGSGACFCLIMEGTKVYLNAGMI